MKKSVKGDLWQDTSKSEREGLRYVIEICYDGWFGGGGAEQKTGGEDAQIFVGSDQNEQD